jgi:hypothetical protein
VNLRLFIFSRNRQNAGMDISTIANVATAITVLTGVLFGLFEVRHFRREREERAAFYLLQTMLTSEWLRSAVAVDTLPDNVAPEILEADPRMLDAAHSIGLIPGGSRLCGYARIVPIAMVEDMMGGIVRDLAQDGALRHARPRPQRIAEGVGMVPMAFYVQSSSTAKQDEPAPRGVRAYRDWKP